MKIDVLLQLEPLLAEYRRVGSNVDYLSKTKSKKEPYPEKIDMWVKPREGRPNTGMGGQEK